MFPWRLSIWLFEPDILLLHIPVMADVRLIVTLPLPPRVCRISRILWSRRMKEKIPSLSDITLLYMNTLNIARMILMLGTWLNCLPYSESNHLSDVVWDLYASVFNCYFICNICIEIFILNSVWQRDTFTLKTKGHQFDNFVVIGCTVSCNNNLRCHQWRQVVKLTIFCFQCIH